MSGSEEDLERSRAIAPIPGSTDAVRALAGWLALLAIPLLLALIGWAGLHNRAPVTSTRRLPSVNPSATLTAPSVNAPDVNAPNVNVPAVNFAPLSIVRNGNGFTSLRRPAEPRRQDGIARQSQAGVRPGINLDRQPERQGRRQRTGLRRRSVRLFGAAVDIPDFDFDLNGDTLTLKGTAPSEDVKAEVEAAAKAAWPKMKIVNNIR